MKAQLLTAIAFVNVLAILLVVSIVVNFHLAIKLDNAEKSYDNLHEMFCNEENCQGGNKMSKIIKHIDNIPVYDGDVAYFDDWLVKEHGKTEEAVKDDMIYHGSTEDEINEALNNLKDNFHDWCEENDLSGFEV